MIAIVLGVLASLLTIVNGRCQSLDGQNVPWWILYQQKERSFFHQYVDSTNSYKIKVFTMELIKDKIRQNKRDREKRLLPQSLYFGEE